jgi:hypothetical protein
MKIITRAFVIVTITLFNHALNAQNEFFYEDFSAGNYFTLYSGVEANALTNNDKIVLTGGTALFWFGAGDSTNSYNAWVENNGHQATASAYMNAENYNSVELKVKIRQIAEVSTKHSWFRVLCNGYQRSDICGRENFNPATLTNDPYTTLTFNLNDLAGSTFVLSFQSACKLQLLDAVFIDEVRLIYNNLEQALEIPLSEDFFAGWLPMGWGTCSNEESHGWLTGTTSAITSGSNYIFTENIASDGAMLINHLQLPVFDLSYQQNSNLQFDLIQSSAVQLLASTDSGASWSDTLSSFSGNTTWQNQNISISAYDNLPYVMFAFASEDTSDLAGVIGLDNVQLTAQNNSIIELSIDSLLTPQQQSIYSQTETVSIRLANNSSSPVSDIIIYYQLSNGFAHSQNIPGPIAANSFQDIVYTQTLDLTLLGNHELRCWVNKAYDTVSGNDSLITAFNITIPTITTFPYAQTFENEQFWVTGGVNSSWEVGLPTGSFINTASSGQKVCATNLDGEYNSYEYSYMTSPIFDLSTVSTPVIQFDLLYSTVVVEDGACIQYSINQGQSWQVIGVFGDDNNWYNNAWVYALFNTGQFNGWSGEEHNDWANSKYELLFLAGESQVQFRFAFGSSDNTADMDGFAFDNFLVYDKPSNDLAVTDLIHPNYDCVLSANEAVSIQIKNLGLNQINGFTASYSVDGGLFITEQVNVSLLPDSVTNYTFFNLADFSANGQHTVVIAVFEQLDGLWFNDSLSFELDFVAPAALPFTENFESGSLPDNWSLTQAYDSDGWFIGTDQSSTYFQPPAHTTYASSNDDSCYCDMSVDYLITPYFDFTNYINIQLSFESYLSGLYGSTGHILVSTDCGNNWTHLDSIPANDSLWLSNQIDLSAYTGFSNVKLAFHHNDNLAWSDGLAIDNVQITADELFGTQSIPLKAGWGILSTYLDPVPSLFNTVCADINPNLVIMKSGSGAVYWPVFSVNSIGYFTIGEGYQYLMLSADTLVVEGYNIAPDQTPLTVPVGWSVLGYIRTSPGQLIQMISTINGNIIILKDEDGAVYWPAFLLDMIGVMEPGKGYQLKLDAQATLLYPAN